MTNSQSVKSCLVRQKKSKRLRGFWGEKRKVQIRLSKGGKRGLTEVWQCGRLGEEGERPLIVWAEGGGGQKPL